MIKLVDHEVCRSLRDFDGSGVPQIIPTHTSLPQFARRFVTTLYHIPTPQRVTEGIETWPGTKAQDREEKALCQHRLRRAQVSQVRHHQATLGKAEVSGRRILQLISLVACFELTSDL
jgi:hypothetical protein